MGGSPLKGLTQGDQSTSIGVGSPKAMAQYSNTIVIGILSTTLRACLLLNSASRIILEEYIEQCFTLDEGLVIIFFALHIKIGKMVFTCQNELLLQVQGNQSLHP